MTKILDKARTLSENLEELLESHDFKLVEYVTNQVRGGSIPDLAFVKTNRESFCSDLIQLVDDFFHSIDLSDPETVKELQSEESYVADGMALMQVLDAVRKAANETDLGSAIEAKKLLDQMEVIVIGTKPEEYVYLHTDCFRAVKDYLQRSGNDAEQFMINDAIEIHKFTGEQLVVNEVYRIVAPDGKLVKLSKGEMYIKVLEERRQQILNP